MLRTKLAGFSQQSIVLGMRYVAGPAQVSASSSVKKVAGKLAHSAREGDPPAVLAIGADSLNQAIKVGRCSPPSAVSMSAKRWMQAMNPESQPWSPFLLC